MFRIAGTSPRCLAQHSIEELGTRTKSKENEEIKKIYNPDPHMYPTSTTSLIQKKMQNSKKREAWLFLTTPKREGRQPLSAQIRQK